MTDLSNENIIHVNQNGIQYIQFRRLLEYNDILTHCFTLKPLDFGGYSNYEKDKEIINKNYKIICNELKINPENIVRPIQTHTNIVEKVNDETGIFNNKFKDVDGLTTDTKNRALSLTYADCTPICLFDPVKKVIGNIHSGWKGTVQQISKVAIEKMCGIYNCNPKDIICTIGPTIRKCHFEVEDDVKEKFLNQFNYIDNIVEIGEIKQGKQKYYIDTVRINKEILVENGLRKENIIDSGICTVCKSNIIHSYREEGLSAGRNTALIMLK